MRVGWTEKQSQGQPGELLGFGEQADFTPTGSADTPKGHAQSSRVLCSGPNDPGARQEEEQGLSDAPSTGFQIKEAHQRAR